MGEFTICFVPIPDTQIIFPDKKIYQVKHENNFNRK